MSFYTVFDTETVVTTTTTANLMSPNDPILIHSGALKRKAQATVGSISTLWGVSTSSSTATALAAVGVQVLNNPTLAVTYQLADPTQKGQNVFIFMTSTTSTATNVTPISATISASESTAGAAASIVFKSAPSSIELCALSTSQWLVTARSGSILCT